MGTKFELNPTAPIGLTGVLSVAAPGGLEAWTVGTFAPQWFADARAEAERTEDQGARRREILFAVATAESYLIEWVRDDVLGHDYRALDRYFRPGDRRRIADKWKEVPERLHGDGKIAAPLDRSRHQWADFVRLMDFRSGLAHGRASRPSRRGAAPDSQPMPSLQDLQGLPPGWAVGVVRDLIVELHRTAGTTPPAWLMPA